MYVVSEITFVYKNGAVVKVDGVLSLDFKSNSEGASAKWLTVPWSKERIVVLNPSEIISIFSRSKKVWNPLKIFAIRRALKNL